MGTFRYLHAYFVYFQVCVQNGPFGPQIGQYIGFSQFSGKVSTGFTQNLIYKFIRGTFVGV